jgi:glucose-1-phosphate thymidylyltransferase
MHPPDEKNAHRTWGIIPAAGKGTRLRPLAFSKELLPVGSYLENGYARPRAVSEYLVERMVSAGATRLCFVISPGKADILAYFQGRAFHADIFYALQDQPGGLCDAIFRAAPLIREDEDVLVGLPDTIWFPTDALRHLPRTALSFLLFPVTDPEHFDVVLTGPDNRVQQIEVKVRGCRSHWIWGAFRLTGATFHKLHRLWLDRGKTDEYWGTLVNEYLAGGGAAFGYRIGQSYVDVGTLDGYRSALNLLDRLSEAASSDRGECDSYVVAGGR